MQRTWEDNWKFCCDRGMQPLTFETLDNMRCLIQNLQGFMKRDSKIIYLYVSRDQKQMIKILNIQFSETVC